MPTNQLVIKRILEQYGPQTTKQIFVHYPEAGSVNHLKNVILRRLEGDNHIWKVHRPVDGVGKHLWMTRDQKLAWNAEKRASGTPSSTEGASAAAEART